MRSLVLALALGASALGVTAVPTNANAAHPAPCRVAPARVYRPAHYHLHSWAHDRHCRPAVGVYSPPVYRAFPGCVPAPRCR